MKSIAKNQIITFLCLNLYRALKVNTHQTLVHKSLHELAYPHLFQGVSYYYPLPAGLSMLQTPDVSLILETHQDFSCFRTFVPFPSSPRSSHGCFLLCIQVTAQYHLSKRLTLNHSTWSGLHSPPSHPSTVLLRLSPCIHTAWTVFRNSVFLNFIELFMVCNPSLIESTRPRRQRALF